MSLDKVRFYVMESSNNLEINVRNTYNIRSVLRGRHQTAAKRLTEMNMCEARR